MGPFFEGFNYFLKPDYSFTESWIDFNAGRTELELRRAKAHFPVINTIRLQLSWDVYNIDPGRFGRNFETVLRIAERLDLKIILTELKKRNIGWVAAKLHQGQKERQMPPGEPIRADGTLREGHEVFNDF